MPHPRNTIFAIFNPYTDPLPLNSSAPKFVNFTYLLSPLTFDQEISQDLFIQLIFLGHESDFWLHEANLVD